MMPPPVHLPGAACKAEGEMDGRSRSTSFGKLAAGGVREGNKVPGKNGAGAVVVDRGRENGGGAGDLNPAIVGGGTILRDLKAAVAGVALDRVEAGCVDLDGTASGDRGCAD